jgi:hypothetical protein
MDKPWSTKHYIENKRTSKTSTTNNRGMNSGAPESWSVPTLLVVMRTNLYIYVVITYVMRTNLYIYVVITYVMRTNLYIYVLCLIYDISQMAIKWIFHALFYPPGATSKVGTDAWHKLSQHRYISLYAWHKLSQHRYINRYVLQIKKFYPDWILEIKMYSN